MAARKTSTFWYFIAKAIFGLTGWRQTGQVPPDIKKSMMIAAPHTSNWDIILARAAFYIMDVDVRFTVKSEWVNNFWLGWLVKAIGALPVNRSRNNNLVEGMAQLFNEYDELVILITPEGTRTYQPKWRKGFYYAAQEAHVPIILSFLDYSKKEAGVGPVFWPTGDYEKDLEEIKSFYRTKKGRFPAQGVR